MGHDPEHFNLLVQPYGNHFRLRCRKSLIDAAAGPVLQDTLNF